MPYFYYMERVYTFDLHTHVMEHKVDAEKYWGKAREIGLDGIAICEHADLNPREAYEMLAAEKPNDLLLLPGIEINSKVGHLLAYYHNTEIYEARGLLKKSIALKKVIEICEENNFLLSLSHPWGFDYDSIGYILSPKKLEELVTTEYIGVEVYNGMIGHLSNFIYDSGWIKRPVNFLDFLEKNRITRKIGITRLSNRIRSKIDNERLDVIKRSAISIELGNKASFVTAGSDAHSHERVGAGIIKFVSERSGLTERTLIEEIKKKEQVIWSGPLVRETEEGTYEKIDDPLKRKEIVQGIRYATGKIIKKSSIKERVTKSVGKTALKKKLSGVRKRLKKVT